MYFGEDPQVFLSKKGQYGGFLLFLQFGNKSALLINLLINNNN